MSESRYLGEAKRLADAHIAYDVAQTLAVIAAADALERIAEHLEIGGA